MTVKVTNNGFSTLSAGITDSATTITLASGEGSRFPNPSSPDVFYATLIDTSNNLEIVKVTARSSDSLTVVRAQDNTSARAFSTGDRFELRPVAKLFEDIQAEARDLNGAELVLDADGDTSITADTDDRIDIRVGGTDVAYISSNSGQGALINRKTATPLIINGDMQIAQRGTSATGLTSTGYQTLDRWRFVALSLGTWTMSQDTDVPTGQGFSSSLKLDCTTANASLGAGNVLQLQTRFEGQNCQMLKKGTSSAESVTISFWVKSPKTGTHIAELRDIDNTRHISKSYTVSSANTWEKKVISFAGDTTGVLDNDNSVSFDLQFWLGAGTNYTSGTLATSWASTTDANRAVGQVNVGDNTANNFYLTGVQLEVGTFDANSIPPFQFEDVGTSLARCQRYYYVHAEGLNKTIGAGANFSSSLLTCSVHFPTTMRSAPSLDQDTGTSYFRFSRSNNHDLFDSFTQLQRPSVNGVQLDNNSQISGTQGDGGSVYTYNASAKIAFDSEL